MVYYIIVRGLKLELTVIVLIAFLISFKNPGSPSLTQQKKIIFDLEKGL